MKFILEELCPVILRNSYRQESKREEGDEPKTTAIAFLTQGRSTFTKCKSLLVAAVREPFVRYAHTRRKSFVPTSIFSLPSNSPSLEETVSLHCFACSDSKNFWRLVNQRVRLRYTIIRKRSASTYECATVSSVKSTDNNTAITKTKVDTTTERKNERFPLKSFYQLLSDEHLRPMGVGRGRLIHDAQCIYRERLVNSSGSRASATRLERFIPFSFFLRDPLFCVCVCVCACVRVCVSFFSFFFFSLAR